MKATVVYGNISSIKGNLDDWQKTANPWTVTLHSGRKRMTVEFWTGPALGEPDGADVMQCLAADASGFINSRSFEDWCAEYGYDADSRRAESIYKSVDKQTAKLRKFLGADFESVIYSGDDMIAKMFD